MFRAGQTYFLPPRHGDALLPDPDSHPHVLGRSCEIGQPAALFFGSTRPTEKDAGAACARVFPRPYRTYHPQHNGLRAWTYFYPGVIVRMPSRQLPRSVGRIGVEWNAVLRACRTALGIGTGRWNDPGAAAGSLRGRVVRLASRYGDALFTSSFVVLTEHAYSARRRYQVVLPIYFAEHLEEAGGVVVAETLEWVEILGDGSASAMLMAPLVFSIREESAGLVPTPFTLDAATLDRVDASLCRYFGLESGSGTGAGT